ncbi:MAG TPA: serine/threonine-protein kinase, partial [Thermoanaerobaculia bacterium]|nr:serine/threonine-protein kinase [Thermoanaerobaculia bacterium]
MTLSAGDRLGPYEILGPLGAGGMGEVFRARDTRLGRMVAIKVLPPRLAQDAQALDRFEREGRAVAALSHPNILALHDVGRVDGVSYAVAELLEGVTLRERLAQGALPPRKAAEIAAQIARGLGAAHQQGVIHRDLKPENVFLTRDGRVKILDFGLAKVTPEAATGSRVGEATTLADATEPGTVLGTVGYMAPEQVRGLPADRRSDLFALGAILYELVTGECAFRRDTTIATLNAVLGEEPQLLAGLQPGVPAPIGPLVAGCLEKDAARRFQSARDLALALRAVAAPPSLPPTEPGIKRPLPSAARQRRALPRRAV